jgi:hypothetical protein
MCEQKREGKLSKGESLLVYCDIISSRLDDMRRLIRGMIEDEAKKQGPKPEQSTEDVSEPYPF